jgi:hypothetical protein
LLHSAERGRSARLVRTVRPCRSTAENATVSSNGYINGYIAFNAKSDKASRGRSGRAPRTVREAAIIHFCEPVTFVFFGSLPTGRSAPEAGQSARGPRWSALFLWTVRSADLDFCIGSVRGSSWCCGLSAARARTVHAWPVFSKKLLLSGIIYGIPDSRFCIVVDEPLAPVEHII